MSVSSLVSLGKAGIRALALGLFESMRERGIHLATVTVAALISPGLQEAEAVAAKFWELYNQHRTDWTVESTFAWSTCPCLSANDEDVLGQVPF